MDYIIVGLGGFLGSISRFGFYQLEKKFALMAFPYTTLLVNTLGCLVAGLILGYSQKNTFLLKNSFSLFLTIGFLGSFTTFSAFGIDTFKMITSHQWDLVILNIFTNFFLTILSVYFGFWLTSKIFF